MTEARNYITPRGYKRHRDAYQWLRVVVRPRIVEEVAHAASLGDRSENAEYIYGKKKLREVDRQLRHLARRMGACEVVDPAIDRGETVYFGATVTLVWPDGASRRFEVIGEDEIEAAPVEGQRDGETGRSSGSAPGSSGRSSGSAPGSSGRSSGSAPGSSGRISWRSPLGQTLLRRREGDTVSFRGGQDGRLVRLEILEVAYLPQQPDPPSEWERHQAEMRARAGGVLEESPLDLNLPEDVQDDDEG